MTGGSDLASELSAKNTGLNHLYQQENIMLENQNAGSNLSLSSGGDVLVFGANQLPDVFGIVQYLRQIKGCQPTKEWGG
jgi:hypothetical protein